MYLSLTCSGVIVGAVSGSLTPFVEEFSLEAMYFHDCCFRGWKVSESVTLMSGFLKMRAAWQAYFFRVRRVAANELSPSGP